MPFAISREEVFGYLQAPQQEMSGMASLFHDVEVNSVKVQQREEISDSLGTTLEFLQKLDGVEPKHGGRILISWSVSPFINFTLKFERDHLIANRTDGTMAVKTEYVELFAHYGFLHEQVELNDTHEEFVVFRKKMVHMPPGLCRAAIRIVPNAA